MIEVKNSSGTTRYLIGADGIMRDTGGKIIPAPRLAPPMWGDETQPHVYIAGNLWFEGVSTSLDGSRVYTFRVGCNGDYVRWIGRDGVGSWDLWRTAGTRVDKAYVTGE